MEDVQWRLTAITPNETIFRIIILFAVETSKSLASQIFYDHQLLASFQSQGFSIQIQLFLYTGFPSRIQRILEKSDVA